MIAILSVAFWAGLTAQKSENRLKTDTKTGSCSRLFSTMLASINPVRVYLEARDVNAQANTAWDQLGCCSYGFQSAA
jgi:hypothetical protein